jgi:hypothetical protein
MSDPKFRCWIPEGVMGAETVGSLEDTSDRFIFGVKSMREDGLISFFIKKKEKDLSNII